MTRIRLLAASSLLVFFLACGPGTDNGGDGGGAGGGAGGSGGGSGALTIANCVTDIAADAPDFYKTYFRCVTITMSGTDVKITTTGLPPHLSNYYADSDPNWTAFDTSRGSQYMENPNKLSQTNFTITIPASPTSKGLTNINGALVDGAVGTSTDEYGLGPQGIALDSVLLFNPLAAPGDDIENEKFTFDDYNAHPTNNGAYHYHTVSKGPLEVLEAEGLTTGTTPGSASVEVYGMMCDGTPLLGCTELDGSAPNTGDLDSQNGHVHDISDGTTTHFTARYHAHVCETLGTHKFTPEIQYYQQCAR